MAQGHQNFRQKFLNSLLCASNDPNAPKKTWGRKCINCMKPTEDYVPTQEGDNEPPRQTWNNRCTFFLTTLGMSVGLGQVWRFPTLAYKEGGGLFLIIYGVVIFIFGNTLFFFEVVNGQYSSKNPLRVYDKVPLFQGIGWSMVAYAYLFCTYYCHMVSYSFYYFFSSFTSHLPWSWCPTNQDDFRDSYTCMSYPKHRDPELDGIVCGNEGFIYNHTELCRNSSYAEEQKKICCELAKVPNDKCNSTFNVTELCRHREYPSEYYWNHVVNRVYREDDPEYGSLGELNWWLFLTLTFSWFVVYVVLYKGLTTLGVLMYIMVPLPYIILFIMLGVVVPQEGAGFGLKKFFTPSVSSLYDITVWRTATEQAFYSLGVAMGPIVTFGSYSKFNNPSHVESSLICLCIFLTSVLCSLVVFSVLGFLSVKTGRPFKKVVEAGPGLVYIVYPESLELLPCPQMFSALFYLMLINLGLSSVTGIIETVPSVVYDIWPVTRRYKYLVNLGVLSSCWLVGFPITLRGGLVLYNAFDIFSAGLPLIPLCALELAIILFFYGLGRFCEDIQFMLGFYPNRYYRYSWMLGPFLLATVYVIGMVSFGKPMKILWGKVVGWFLFLVVIIFIPAGMIYNIVIYKKQNNLKNILKAPPEHGPKKESDREARANFSVKRKIF